MENLKLKLIESIIKTNDLKILNQIKEILFAYRQSENKNIVAETESIYESEKPMTEEDITLPNEILEILKICQKQVENGEYYTNEEVEKYFDEWLED